MTLKWKSANKAETTNNRKRTIWLFYRTDTNARGFWLPANARLKNLHARELSGNQSILRFDAILQHGWPIEQRLPYIRVFWREKEEAMFWSFHPLTDKTNNEHSPKPFFKVIRKSLYAEVKPSLHFCSNAFLYQYEFYKLKLFSWKRFITRFAVLLDCEQSPFSQSSLSSAGLERGKPQLPLGFLFFPFARFARFPRSRYHPEAPRAVYEGGDLIVFLALG